MRSEDCGRRALGWLASRAVDPTALRSELDLVAWDPRALDGRVLALRLQPRPMGGYALTHVDGRRFAWIDDPRTCRYAPEAVTAGSVLAMGREHLASRRYVVLDRSSGAELVSILTWRMRRGADLQPAFGERLRLKAPMIGSHWRARDESKTVALRVSSQPSDAARLWLEGPQHAALDLTLVLAVVYTVLTLDALMALGASMDGGGGG
jgi:hypothetical protein